MSGDDKQQEKPTEAPAAGIPEVEAELVEEGAAEDAAPFDEPASSGGKTARRSFIRPGVLFFAGLVVIASAAGFYWYFVVDKEPLPTTSESVVRQEEDDILPGATSPVGEADKKIANTGAASIKEPAATSSPEGSTLADAVADVTTSTDIIENADLIEEAKGAIVDSSASPAIVEDAAPEPSPESKETAPEPEDDAPLGPALDDNAQEAIAEDTSGDTTPTDVSEPDAPVDAVKPGAAETAALAPGEPAKETHIVEDSAVASLEAALIEERTRIAALAAELDTVRLDLAAANDALEEARSALGVANDKIRALRTENEALKSARRETPLADAAIALNAIEKAAGAGAPYEAELAALKRVAPDAGAIALLNSYALGGAPTLEDLRADFAAAARDGLAVAIRENADSIFERYGARVAALFNIRPAAPQPGNNPAAIISRAEDAAEKGDLPRAIAELAGLPPDARRAMKGWTQRAQRRVEIDAALQLLSAELAEKAAQPESL